MRNSGGFKMNRFQKTIARFLIPRGMYCHFPDMKQVCPFWSIDKTRHEHEGGYCSYLGKGDWDLNLEGPEEVKVSVRQEDGSYRDEMWKREDLPDGGRDSLLWDQCKMCGVKDSIK